MKFTYIGQPNETAPVPEINFRGIKFKLNGPAVDVTDPETIRKLRGNNHFESVPDDTFPLPPLDVPAGQGEVNAPPQAGKKRAKRS